MGFLLCCPISSSLSRLGGAAGGRAVRCGVCVCATATTDRSQETIGFVLLTTKALSKITKLRTSLHEDEDCEGDRLAAIQTREAAYMCVCAGGAGVGRKGERFFLRAPSLLIVQTQWSLERLVVAVAHTHTPRRTARPPAAPPRRERDEEMGQRRRSPNTYGRVQ